MGERMPESGSRRGIAGGLGAGLATGLAIVGTLLLVVLAAPLLAGDPQLQGDLLVDRLLPPSGAHPLGTDQFGRDVWSRLLHGGRVSLLIGFGAAMVSAVIGTAVGAVSGYFGGWVDRVLMRGVDLVLAFPRLVLLIVVVGLFRPGLGVIAVVIGLTQWPTTARLVRAEVLSLRERDWVTAARVIGHSEPWILRHHLLPNALPPVLVVTALGVGYAILLEAGLSFLGLGVQPPAASWGSMIADGRDHLLNAWWLATFPGLAVVLVVIGLNLVGDGLRDRLDPRGPTSGGVGPGPREAAAPVAPTLEHR